MPANKQEKQKSGGARKYGRGTGRTNCHGERTGGGSDRYRLMGRRETNKRKRMAREEERRNPLPCGHGSRHLSPYDKKCRVCHRRAWAKRKLEEIRGTLEP